MTVNNLLTQPVHNTPSRSGGEPLMMGWGQWLWHECSTNEATTTMKESLSVKANKTYWAVGTGAQGIARWYWDHTHPRADFPVLPVEASDEISIFYGRQGKLSPVPKFPYDSLAQSHASLTTHGALDQASLRKEIYYASC